MSAGHSLRRQNYSFVSIKPTVLPQGTSWAMHITRLIAVIFSAVALDVATFATISMLITGR